MVLSSTQKIAHYGSNLALFDTSSKVLSYSLNDGNDFVDIQLPTSITGFYDMIVTPSHVYLAVSDTYTACYILDLSDGTYRRFASSQKATGYLTPAFPHVIFSMVSTSNYYCYFYVFDYQTTTLLSSQTYATSFYPGKYVKQVSDTTYEIYSRERDSDTSNYYFYVYKHLYNTTTKQLTFVSSYKKTHSRSSSLSVYDYDYASYYYNKKTTAYYDYQNLKSLYTYTFDSAATQQAFFLTPDENVIEAYSYGSYKGFFLFQNGELIEEVKDATLVSLSVCAEDRRYVYCLFKKSTTEFYLQKYQVYNGKYKKDLSLVEEILSEAAELPIKEEIEATDFFIDFEETPNPPSYIDLSHLYDGFTTIYYDATQKNVLASNTITHSNKTNSYIKFETKKPNETISFDAAISSESYDYGTVHLTKTVEAPSYSTATDRIVRISGNTTSSTTFKTYETTIAEPGIYYLHFAYTKDGSVSSGKDKFYIDNIKLPIYKIQSGAIELKEQVVNGIAWELPLNEKVIAEATTIFDIKETIYAEAENAIDIHDRVVETLHTTHLPVKESILVQDKSLLNMKENVFYQEARGFELQETIDSFPNVTKTNINFDPYMVAVYHDRFYCFDGYCRFYDLKDTTKPVLLKNWYDWNSVEIKQIDHRLVMVGHKTDDSSIQLCIYDMANEKFILDKSFDGTAFNGYSLDKVEMNNDHIFCNFYKLSGYNRAYGPSAHFTKFDTDSPVLEVATTGRMITVEGDYVYYALLNGSTYNLIQKQHITNLDDKTTYTVNVQVLNGFYTKADIREGNMYVRYYDEYYCFNLETGAKAWETKKANTSMHSGIFAYINHQPALLCTEYKDNVYTTHMYKKNTIQESFQNTSDIDGGVFFDNCIYTCSSLSVVGDNWGVIVRYALVRDVKLPFPLNEFVLDPTGLALTEKVIEEGNSTFPILETIENYKAGIDVYEYIQGYKWNYKETKIYEWVTPIPVHNKNLLIFEDIKFKTGEWGEDFAKLEVKETVDPKPCKDLTIKEETVKKPDPIVTKKELEGYMHFTVFDANKLAHYGTYEKYDDKESGLYGDLYNPYSVFKSINSTFANYSEYFMADIRMPAATKVIDRYIGINIKDGVARPITTGKWHSEIPYVYHLVDIKSKKSITQDDLTIKDGYTGKLLEFHSKVGNTLYYKIEQNTTKVYMQPNYNIMFELEGVDLYEVNSFNDGLYLKESVIAYSSGLSVKETSKPNQKFDCYDLDYLTKPATIDDTYHYFELQFPLYKDNLVFFETSINAIKNITRFTFYDGNNSGSVQTMTYEPDYYIIKRGNKETFCYGFAVTIPLTCYKVAISRSLPGDPFALLAVHQAKSAPKTLGELYLPMQESITNYERFLPIEEAIWEEGHIFSGIDYMPLLERVIATPATKVQLPIKESAVGTWANNYLFTRETIKINERPVYNEYYLGYWQTTFVAPFPDDHYLSANKRVFFISGNELLFAKIPETYNPNQRTFIRISTFSTDSNWNDFMGIVIGLVNSEGECVEVDRLTSFWFENKLDITADITPYIETYLKRSDAANKGLRVGYIGTSAGNVYFKPRYFKDFAVLQSYTESDTIQMKETVLSSTNPVNTPYLIYRVEGYKQYVHYLGDTIPLRNADYIYFPFEQPIVPRRVIIETSQPINTIGSKAENGFTAESYLSSEMNYTITPEGHYLYDIVLNTHPFSISFTEPKVPITRLLLTMNYKAEDVVFYNIEVYYSNIKQRRFIYMREDIYTYLPNKRMNIKEYVYEKPYKRLFLEENVSKDIGGNRSVALSEYVSTKEHVSSSQTLAMTETVKHPTWSGGLLLQEVVPSDPVKDNLPVYEYVLDQQDIKMPVKENVIVYKNGVDGKVMVEIVK